ncbi:hypothetical protein X975_26306, partial [Stegodyphus mimosarum]
MFCFDLSIAEIASSVVVAAVNICSCFCFLLEFVVVGVCVCLSIMLVCYVIPKFSEIFQYRLFQNLDLLASRKNI